MTSLDSDIGPHTITLTVTLDNYTGVAAASTTFDVTINACVITSMVLATGDINESTPTFTYNIGATQMDTAVPVFVQTPACGYPVTVSTTNTDPWLSLPGSGAEGTVYRVYTVDVSIDATTVPVTFTGTAA